MLPFEEFLFFVPIFPNLLMAFVVPRGLFFALFQEGLNSGLHLFKTFLPNLVSLSRFYLETDGWFGWGSRYAGWERLHIVIVVEHFCRICHFDCLYAFRD